MLNITNTFEKPRILNGLTEKGGLDFWNPEQEARKQKTIEAIKNIEATVVDNSELNKPEVIKIKAPELDICNEKGQIDIKKIEKKIRGISTFQLARTLDQYSKIIRENWVLE